MTESKSASSKCGFAALIGAPNAGKSTLMNTLLGTKVSIVTPKAQTTRSRISGVLTSDNAQLVFVDTPGIFPPRRRLERAMVTAAWNGAFDADIIVLLIDVTSGMRSDTQKIIHKLVESKRTAICVLNKIDRIKRSNLLKIVEALKPKNLFTDYFMISALNGDGVTDLKNFLISQLPSGPWHFPEDQLSDMNERLFAAEITREKLFLNLHEELPYSLTVETTGWEDFKNGAVRIEQVLYVDKKSHKGITLGRAGTRIKLVRSLAQVELKDLLGRDVHLFLFVKVREKWWEDPQHYRDWGLDFGS